MKNKEEFGALDRAYLGSIPQMMIIQVIIAELLEEIMDKQQGEGSYKRRFNELLKERLGDVKERREVDELERMLRKNKGRGDRDDD